MSEKVKWRRKKNPGGTSTFRVGGDSIDKSSLPRGLMPVQTTLREPKEPVREKYTHGNMVVDSLGEHLTGWKLARQSKECAILLQRYETGNYLEKMEAKVHLMKKYPRIYKKFNELSIDE